MNCAGNIWSIAKRELSGTVSSPVAYVFVVIFLLLSSFFTFMIGGFFERGQATLISFFGWHPWLYLFLVPAVGMRMWAEERRSGTIELLFTLPITTWQAIAGKVLAYLVILAVGLRPLDRARAPILRGPGAPGLTAMARSGSMTTAE
jgi:ABC-2 type transport system permease protein